MNFIQQATIGIPSTINQDIALHQRASELDSSGDFSVRGSSYRKNLNMFSKSRSSQSPMSLAPAEMLSTEQAAPPSVQAPNFFITNRSHMYAFMPNGGTQISSSKQNDPSFKIPTSRAAQPGPSFLNFHVPVVHGTRHYASGSKMVVKAATGDVSAYRICSPATSLPQGVVMASSPSPLHSSQQLAEEASRKRELRLMKNRNAAKECRRRKREYINYLEVHASILEQQNKKLMEELNYLKGICEQKPIDGSKQCSLVWQFLQTVVYGLPGEDTSTATGDVSAYRICSPATSLPQGVVMASSPSPLHSSQQLAEEASRKRELRLMKNRL
ncbi:cAMP-responsive element modulator-like isoform X4 [Tachysurus fulvidraco]|uniref:cAMP-responsive element modulator-like isoform X4 n=1 Tax=Tachysurus fulvidraco TaxID=1234273 RepID=UPI001FEDFDC0|nr:cAMP-responsive element modulator-like isoform X4 [Tachysurus fulvidraco]